MANPTVIKLQDGNVMPQLGLGVWQASNEEVITAIQKALEVGYRSIRYRRGLQERRRCRQSPEKCLSQQRRTVHHH